MLGNVIRAIAPSAGAGATVGAVTQEPVVTALVTIVTFLIERLVHRFGSK